MIEEILQTIQVDISTIKADVVQVKTVILGVPGTEEGGLVGKVKSQGTQLSRMTERLNKLNLRFWILVAILAGSTGGSAYGILKLL